MTKFLDKQQLAELKKLSGSGGHQKQLATLLIRHKLTATVDLKSFPRFAAAMKIALMKAFHVSSRGAMEGQGCGTQENSKEH